MNEQKKSAQTVPAVRAQVKKLYISTITLIRKKCKTLTRF